MLSKWFAVAAIVLVACGRQTNIEQLPTGVDPTLSDVAVTDADLLTAGSDDTMPVLVDHPAMLIVDDDKVQCPNAQFTSINAAIAAALPGATIRVCPGLYRESVHVNKAGLFLQAPREQGHATQCQKPSVPDPSREAIVAYNAGFLGALIGFFIEADNVTVEGFTIQPDVTVTAAQIGIGIFTSPAFSGYDVRHNLAQNNEFGIDVNSHGDNTTHVRENCLRNNNLNQAQAGFGIFSNVGLRNARIENNFCTGQRMFCILLTGGPNVDVQVTHNASVNDSAIALNATTNFVIDYNKVTNPTNAAILIGAGVDTGEVSFNKLSGGPASGNGISILAAKAFSNATASPRNLMVKSNKVVGFARDGIRLGDASTANTLVSNRVENNTLAGIRATEQANNNTIQDNHMRGDNPDCFDDTHGAGTSGTANFWIHDIGFTEAPAGICKHGKE
jgi:parallel beta-helix repeat protein